MDSPLSADLLQNTSSGRWAPLNCSVRQFSLQFKCNILLFFVCVGVAQSRQGQKVWAACSNLVKVYHSATSNRSRIHSTYSAVLWICCSRCRLYSISVAENPTLQTEWNDSVGFLCHVKNSHCTFSSSGCEVGLTVCWQSLLSATFTTSVWSRDRAEACHFHLQTPSYHFKHFKHFCLQSVCMLNPPSAMFWSQLVHSDASNDFSFLCTWCLYALDMWLCGFSVTCFFSSSVFSKSGSQNARCIVSYC